MASLMTTTSYVALAGSTGDAVMFIARTVTVSAAETRARLAGFVPEYRAADDRGLPEGVVAFVPRVSPGPQAGAERSP